MGSKGGGAASGAMQTALNNQSQVNGQIQNYANQFANQNNQYYSTPLSGLTNTVNSSLQAVSPGLTSGLSTLLGNGGNASQMTGVDQNKVGQQFTQYATNTGGTNLAQQTPGLQQFYQGQMQNGMDPAVAQNAQNQVQQNLQTQLNTAKAHAAPGQNVNALQKDMQNQSIASSANLGGQIAGQNQEAKSAGASGLASTASGLDSQTMQMLQSALTGSTGLNSQTIQNLIAALSQGSNVLSGTQNFVGQGTNNVNNALGALGGVAQQNGAQAAQFGQQAAQQQSGGGVLGNLLGLGGLFMTGGASAAGGLGAKIAKL